MPCNIDVAKEGQRAWSYHTTSQTSEAIVWNVATMFVWTVGVETSWFSWKIFWWEAEGELRCHVFPLCQQTSLSGKLSVISIGQNIPTGTRRSRNWWEKSVSTFCSRFMNVHTEKFCNKSGCVSIRKTRWNISRPQLNTMEFDATHTHIHWLTSVWLWHTERMCCQWDKCHHMNSFSFLSQSAFVSVSLCEYMCGRIQCTHKTCVWLCGWVTQFWLH